MEAITPSAAAYRNRYFLFIPIMCTIFTLAALRIVSPEGNVNTDFFTFWLSGRLIASGQNPYLAEIWLGASHQFGAVWIPNATFIYPLPISFLFAPLAIFPFRQAYVIWVTLLQFMIIFSAALVLKSYPLALKKHFILPLLAGIVLFRPAILTLYNGQLSAFILLMLAFVIYFWEQGKWWQGSIFLPVLALKPNLGVPIIFFLALFLLLQKKITSLIAMGLSGVVLLFVGMIHNPNWLIEFWHAGSTKLSQIFGFAPTIWGVSAFFCKYNLRCTLISGGCVGLVILIVCISIIAGKIKSLSPTLIISFAITIMLLLTPSAWPYDQLLLVIPIIGVTMGLAKAGDRFLATALIFLSIDIIAFMMLYISAVVDREFWNVVISFLVFFLLIWYMREDSPVNKDSEYIQL